MFFKGKIRLCNNGIVDILEKCENTRGKWGNERERIEEEEGYSSC
jgi:hypothetical protein